MTLPLDPSLFRFQAAVLILLADSMDAAMQGSASSPTDVDGWLSSETITAKEMNGLTVWKFLFCLAAEWCRLSGQSAEDGYGQWMLPGTQAGRTICIMNARNDACSQPLGAGRALLL